MRALMHDDMTFRGPFDTFRSPQPYLASLEKLHPIVKAVRVKHRFVDGDEVCSHYEMDTDSPAGTAFICEWFTLRDDKVASICAVFDVRPFAAMFGG
jgi:SnoaL-like domain